LPPLDGRVELVAGEAEIIPGINIIAAPGHTPGQLAVLIQSEEQKLLCVADAMHNTVQIAYPEIGYVDDLDKSQALSTRKKLIQQALKDQMLIYGCHFVFPGIGYAKEKDGKTGWESLAIKTRQNH